MKLEFKSVLPFPLQDYQHAEDSVWKKGFALNFPSKVMLNASSGKGKSTFVNTVYGVRFDYDGTVLLDDNDIRLFSLHDWIELRKKSISVVFQDLQLFGELSAWENLQIKNKLTGHKTDDEIMLMLEKLGIPDKKKSIL
ncbi:MAG: ATP-binding cassette domain-containing protein [Crocinitomicaceae bacterium]|nr:ATP-binding cassette domain-containing protein [Crocinitomicaceae bacterium]